MSDYPQEPPQWPPTPVEPPQQWQTPTPPTTETEPIAPSEPATEIPSEPAAEIPPPPLYPPPMIPPPPAKKSRKGLIIGGIIALVVVVAGTALALAGTGSDKITVHGTYSLTDIGGDMGDYSKCEGNGGYGDFSAGQSVKVTDADGKIIGTGTTRHLTNDEDLRSFASEDASEPTGDTVNSDVETLKTLESSGAFCPLLFDVDVEKSEFYEFKVGGGDRGNLTYSAKELADKKFIVNITLGSTH